MGIYLYFYKAKIGTIRIFSKYTLYLCRPYVEYDMIFYRTTKIDSLKTVDFRKYETYALVTGAASGMGRLYAMELAGRGYNLVLVDINRTNLSKITKEVHDMVSGLDGIYADYRENFRILPIVQDLSQPDAAARVADTVGGLEVEVLVNNAGIMFCQEIVSTSRKALSLIMMLHMYTPLMLCREFVPQMLERRKGYILNISSLAAWMEWPAIGMYGNTKRFIKGFSRQIRIECKGTGVSVTNAYFGAVDTPLVPLNTKYRKLARALRVMIPAEKAVGKALKATFKRYKGTMPGLINKIAMPLIAILPDFLLAWLLKKLRPLLMNV